VFVKKFSYVRFEPEGITRNPEIPFAKSMPDYIMRWLASRFLEDPELLEDLGIMTSEVRARREAQQSLFAGNGGDGENGDGNGNDGNGSGDGAADDDEQPTSPAAPEGPIAPTQVMTDSPPVVPAKLAGADLGPACDQCGGMMQRTGSCYTCSSCGNNTGCG
jgi:ribonucleoside-diphosphate reductase alpha chain